MGAVGSPLSMQDLTEAVPRVGGTRSHFLHELLQGKQFRLGDAIDALKGGFRDADVLADDFGSYSGIAQSQRQRIRQRQFAQRLLSITESIGHPMIMRLCW
jgi:hypothetical protein